MLLLAREDDAVVLCLEPLLGVGLGQPVGEADVASLLPPEIHEKKYYVNSRNTNLGGGPKSINPGMAK